MSNASPVATAPVWTTPTLKKGQVGAVTALEIDQFLKGAPIS